MSARETIRTQLTPPARPMRQQPADKANELLRRRTAIPAFRAVVKITTKLQAEHVDWLKEQTDRYGIDHPRAPKLTMEELMRIAVDELRAADNLNGFGGIDRNAQTVAICRALLARRLKSP